MTVRRRIELFLVVCAYATVLYYVTSNFNGCFMECIMEFSRLHQIIIIFNRYYIINLLFRKVQRFMLNG